MAAAAISWREGCLMVAGNLEFVESLVGMAQDFAPSYIIAARRY
jgi:hypothetical protein